MTSLEKQQNITLKQRVTILETELAKIKEILATNLTLQNPWWLQVASSMETDSTFDEATNLGKQWRKFLD